MSTQTVEDNTEQELMRAPKRSTWPQRFTARTKAVASRFCSRLGQLDTMSCRQGSHEVQDSAEQASVRVDLDAESGVTSQGSHFLFRHEGGRSALLQLLVPAAHGRG